MPNVGNIKFLSQDNTSAITVNQDSHSNQVWFTGITQQILMSTLVVSSDSSWLTPDYDIDEDYGEENTDTYGQWVINFNIPANTLTESRTATITVAGRTAGTGVAVTDSLTVTQQAGSGSTTTASFSLNSTGTTITSASQSNTVKYTAQNIGQITVSVSGDSKSWLSAEYNSKNEIRWTATENTSGAERTGKLFICAYSNTSNPYGSNMVFAGYYEITQGAGGFVISPSSIVTDFNEVTGGTIDITWAGISGITGCKVESDVTWLTATLPSKATGVTSGSSVITYTLTENGESDRSSYIRIAYLNSEGFSKTIDIPVTQLASPEKLEFPIWKDQDVTISTESDYISYQFRSEDDTILYNGRAYAFDGVATVRLNNILAEYLYNTIDFAKWSLVDNESYMTFTMYIRYSESDEWSQYRLIRTYNDWSYDKDADPLVFSKFPRYIYDERQYFLFTAFNSYNDSATTISVNPLTLVYDGQVSGITISKIPSYSKVKTADTEDEIATASVDTDEVASDATQETDSSSIVSETDMTYSLNDSFANKSFKLRNQIATICMPASKLSSDGAIVVKASGTTYAFEAKCTKGYVLYYLNSYGGWDWLNCDGKILRQKDFTISSYSKNINNQGIKRNKVNYKKDITEKWQLGTGLLTDAQAEKVADMFSSDKVYLHILDEDRFLPVNITDTSVDYKTYRNNSRKIVTYTIKVENAQNRIMK